MDDDQLKDLESELLKAKGGIGARRALAVLFPKAEEALKVAVVSGAHDLATRRLKRRLSVPDFAPAYFRLDPERASWAKSELDKILNHHDPDTVRFGWSRIEFKPPSTTTDLD